MASVRLDRNVRLTDAATGLQTSTDHEPTLACFLDTVFVTGNMFASHSADNGSTFTFIDPFTAFPATAGGFCCDQIVIHERMHNLWLWVLQYRTDANGSNIFRLAVSPSGGAPGTYSYYDFAPGELDTAWATGVMFDRPDMATTNNHLYITFNVFDTTVTPNNFLAMVVYKIPLDQLAALQALTWRFHRLDSPDGRAIAFARGAATEMFYAGHQLSGGDVRIFRWPDLPLEASITQFDVSPSTWTGVGPYTAPGPGGEWLSKLDSRVMTGWCTGGQVGFLWTANGDSTRPMPYIKAIVVDTNTQSIVAQPDIHNPSLAFAYPACCPNINGTVAISMFQGGGAADPMHIVGFLDGASWILQGTIVSSHAPTGGIWGDYLSCQTHDPDGVDWVASGFTLQGGTGGASVDPQYVRFGVGP